MTPGRRVTFVVLLAVVAGVVLWLVAAPNAWLLLGSLIEPSADGWRFSLEGYARFFARGTAELPTNVELEALHNSVVIALWSVVLSALLGVPLALLFWRYEFPGRRVVAALATVPVLLPPLVGVVAFYFLFAESGVLTRWARQGLGLPLPADWFTGLRAVLIVHAYSFYVYFYVFVTAGLARLDESQLEAARTLGAGRARVFWTVVIPLLTPALVGAGLLVFMMSMASFTAPYVLGGVRVLTTQMLISRQNQQLLLMRAETVVLAAVCIAFLALLRWVEGRGSYVGGSKGVQGEQRIVARGAARYLAGAAGALAVAALLLPHAMLVLISFADNAAWTSQVMPPVYTTENYRYLAADPNGQVPVINSLAMSLQSTAANVIFAIVAAWLLARFRFRGRALLEATAMLPWAIPGTVIALGLAEYFSVHRPLLGRFVLITTYTILPMAYFIRSLPLVLRAVQSSLAQVEPSLEEAAATLGAGPARVLRTVVLPLVAPGAMAGGLLALIAALGEYVASVVLASPANRPIAIEIWSQLRYSFGRAAAYGVVLVVLIALLLLVSQLASRRNVGELVA